MELPGEPRVVYTLLFTRGPEGDVTRLLLDAAGTRLELASVQDPTGRDSTESVLDPVTRERFARRLLLSGYGGVAGCAEVRPPDACVVFTGATGSVTAGLSAFAGEKADETRVRVRALLTPALDEKLSTLVPLFARTAEMVPYGSDFLGLVWPTRFPRSAGAYARGARTPGCDFDAAFGYPCSEAERRRERSPAK